LKQNYQIFSSATFKEIGARQLGANTG